jgi:hypothetical protein
MSSVVLCRVFMNARHAAMWDFEHSKISHGIVCTCQGNKDTEVIAK